VIYAASALESPKDQDIAILVPSNSPVKVWLNGAVVIDSAPGPDTHIGAMVHLRKGRNTLLVKEMCFPLRNDFHIWLATRDGANAYIEEQGGLIVPVKQLIAPRGTSLELTTLVDVRYGGAGNAHEATYEIQNEQGEKVISGDLAEVHEKAVNLGSLPDGLYYLILSNDQTRDRVAFFFGDITQRVREVGSYCTAHARSGLPCDAIPRLLQTLNDPKCGFDLGKQNIAVFLLSQFEGDVLNDGQSKRNVGAVDRIRLMSFRSQMDGSTQHYYMYTPPEVNDGSPSPLVVIVPHNSLTTPFFDNDPTINPFPLQQYASYARRYHLAFIQPFARGARLPSAAGEADILEAIQAARAHYPVDMTRLYLAGDCAGGRSALLMAENFPELFPVVSTIDASTSHFTHLTRTKRDAGNVLLRLRNLRKTFVGLIQEDPDPHSPEEQARILVAQAQEFRFTPDLVILPVDRAPTREYTRQKMFEYLAEHSSCHAQQPMHVDLAIIDFRNRHAYWITVNRLAVAGMPAYVSAELQSRGVIDIKSENVLSLSLDIGKMPDDVKVINGWSIAWNGKHFNSVVASDGMHRQIMLDAEAPRGRPTKGASGAVL
jgi:dienelactone hydrolase